MTAIFTLGIVDLRLNERDEAYKNIKKAEALWPSAGKKYRDALLKDYWPPDVANGNL